MDIRAFSFVTFQIIFVIIPEAPLSAELSLSNQNLNRYPTSCECIFVEIRFPERLASSDSILKVFP